MNSKERFRKVEKEFVRRARMNQADWSTHVYAEGIEYTKPDPPIPEIVSLSLLKIAGEAVMKAVKESSSNLRKSG